jgi:hypothetical protein
MDKAAPGGAKPFTRMGELPGRRVGLSGLCMASARALERPPAARRQWAPLPGACLPPGIALHRLRPISFAMSKHEFTVERVAVGPHEHGYQAVESGTGVVIPLPAGGGVNSTGIYPELQQHLEAQGLKPILAYSPRRGDTRVWDDEKSCNVWTFRTGGCEIVVRDPPRVSGEVSFDAS